MKAPEIPVDRNNLKRNDAHRSVTLAEHDYPLQNDLRSIFHDATRYVCVGLHSIPLKDVRQRCFTMARSSDWPLLPGNLYSLSMDIFKTCRCRE